jgi:hypothetical protein
MTNFLLLNPDFFFYASGPAQKAVPVPNGKPPGVRSLMHTEILKIQFEEEKNLFFGLFFGHFWTKLELETPQSSTFGLFSACAATNQLLSK